MTEKTLAPSMDQVKATQVQLERQLETVSGIMGVGIGFDRKRHRPNLKVMVKDLDQTRQLPRELDDIAVEYEVVGDIKAFGE